jgi:17beta-estradiol 17-dehydrogenase / very-long-chain 3-oxoacyl-CoA reductase
LQIKTIAVDFNRTDIYETIANEISSLDIDVLVNNVEVANKNRCEYFLRIPSEQNDAFFDVNMKSFIKMTEIVLPKMVEKRRGIIINIYHT